MKRRIYFLTFLILNFYESFCQGNLSDTTILGFTCRYKEKLIISFSGGDKYEFIGPTKRDFFNAQIFSIKITDSIFELIDSLGKPYTKIYFKVLKRKRFRYEVIDADTFILCPGKSKYIHLIQNYANYGIFNIELWYTNKELYLR